MKQLWCVYTGVTDTDTEIKTETKTDKMTDKICFVLGVGQSEVNQIFGKYCEGKIEDKQNRAIWSHSSCEKAVNLIYIANSIRFGFIFIRFSIEIISRLQKKTCHYLKQFESCIICVIRSEKQIGKS